MAFTTSYSLARSGSYKWSYNNYTSSGKWETDNIRQGNYGKHKYGTGAGHYSYCGIIDVSATDKEKIKTQYATAYPTKIEITVTRANAGSTGSNITAYVSVGQGLYGSTKPSNQYTYSTHTITAGEGTSSTITLSQTMADYYCNSAQGSTNRIIAYGMISDVGTRNISTPYTAINTTGTMKITWETRTSACGAPTSISFTPVVKPGGELTISWSGATSGTNNTINGYDIYYRIGGAPTTSGYQARKSIDSTNSSGSVTFTLPDNAARGSTFYAIIRTRGTAGSSYYSGFKSGSGGKVNTLPAIPSVTFNYSQVPSSGGTVQITNLSASDADGQSISYYYSTSLSGTKNLVKVKDTFSVTQTTTYYFWSFDNLEYSTSAKSITITCVPKPTVTLEVSGVGTLYETLDNSYYTSYELTATPSAGTGIYKYVYSTDPNPNYNAKEWKEFEVGKAFSTNTYTISDITQYCKPGETIYFDVGYYQSIDYSSYNDSAWYVTEGLTILEMPIYTQIYNNNSNQNLPDTNENYFQDYIRVYFSKDTGIESASAIAIMKDSNIESVVNIFNTSFSGDSPYVVLSTSTLERGKLYKFQVTLKRKSHTTTLIFERTKVFLPNFGEVMTISNSKIRPHLTSDDINEIFEDETLGNDSSFYLSFPNIMGAPTNDLYQYGLSAENDSIKGLTLSVIHNNKTYNLNEQKFKINELSGNILGTTIQVQTLIDNFEALGITSYNGQYSLTFSLSITTNFGYNFTTENSFSPNLILDFDVPFEKFGQTLEMYYYPADGTKWSQIEDNQLLRKGDRIKYSYTWSTYNSYNVNYIAKIYRTSERIDSLNSNIDWVDDIIGTFIYSDINDIPKLGELKTKTIELERTISTITESKYLYFSITGVQNNSSINLTYDKVEEITEKLKPIYAVSVQHTDAITEISNGLYSKGTITLNFSCEDSGLKSLIESETYTANLELEYSETQDFSNFDSLAVKGYLKTETQPGIESTFEEVLITPSNLEKIELIKYESSNETEIWENGANFYYVRLKIITIDSNEGTQTQEIESYSNSIIIYNTTPTISYRTNYVGINYRLPIEEENPELSSTIIKNLKGAVLVIGETSGRNQICFMSSDNINALSGGTWDNIELTEL